MELAEVGPGMRVCDLGCGDGALLLAAAARGAAVVGVELDPSLAADARARLTAAGADAEVVVGDVLTDPLPPADRYLAYLSPALLQRLVNRPGLRTELAGIPLVTVAYRVPGLVPNASVAGSHLHVLPGLDRPLRRGWPWSGIAIAAPARNSLLTYALAGHPGGAVAVTVTGAAADHLDVLVGHDGPMPPGEIAVDLRVAPHADPRARTGEVTIEGVGSLGVVLTGGATQPGWWALGGAHWTDLRHAAEAASGPVDLAAMIARGQDRAAEL